MKKSTTSIFRSIALSTSLIFTGLLSSCDSEPKASDKNSESTNDAPSPKTPASDLDSIHGVLTSEGEYVWALNQLILDMKTKEDAEAAVSKLQEMKTLAGKIAEARKKFPELKNEKALMTEHSKPIMRLTIGRQSLEFTIRAKKNHLKPVHETIQSTVDELLEILPAPHQPTDGQ